MRLPEPRRREPEEGTVPMINIVFLLLIFFMVAGTLTPESPLSVDPAASEAGEAAPEDPIRVLIDAEGRLALGDEVVDGREGLRRRLQERLEEGPERPVEVKPDAEADAERLLEVMDDLRAAGLERVRLITRRED
ncbi:ExbD/TolR family protein [Halorhodospira neutriphila]|uniref:Outer membrane transport energization protein ExbD n=1 Tax=Halorhodospira neutriphila TaxID=168379 RepID=A0ABS1E211_9GAMM|nr:biopolymer transporter ExbD [Halorhodospira neutriphila]MBK1725510.1 hypothetical protein [Halorhodospira neutriphila]